MGCQISYSSQAKQNGEKLINFSVLMSIYQKESPGHFDRAMHSIWSDQTVKPSEVVLVQDGPLPGPLLDRISAWQDQLGSVLNCVILKENVGTGKAKNIGIKACSHDLVAVMDTDDVSLPTRFEKQLAVFELKEQIDVCGAWVGEFEEDENLIVSHRRTPEQHEQIVAFAKSRSPVNHPTAMYRKSSVLSAGNYSELRSSQDFNLFVRLIMNGAKLHNIQEPLVNMRMGNGQLETRRGGLKQALHEASVQKEFYQMGFLSLFELVRNVVIGFSIRILPTALIKLFYKLLRKV